MAPRDQIINFADFDLNRVVADREEIRRYNPHRFEMEQVTAIVYEDTERHICVGYKDVTDQEFWVRGHMPGMPLMPGVMICEAAAQVCSFFIHKHGTIGKGIVLGFGGLEEVRFRDPVRPGDRLWIMAELTRIRPGAMCVCRFQAFVRETLVCEGKLKGVPLPVEALQLASGSTG